MFSLLIHRMIRVVEYACQGIKEHGKGFVKPDTMFPEIVCGLDVVPFESENHCRRRRAVLDSYRRPMQANGSGSGGGGTIWTNSRSVLLNRYCSPSTR